MRSLVLQTIGAESCGKWEPDQIKAIPWVSEGLLIVRTFLRLFAFCIAIHAVFKVTARCLVFNGGRHTEAETKKQTDVSDYVGLRWDAIQNLKRNDRNVFLYLGAFFFSFGSLSFFHGESSFLCRASWRKKRKLVRTVGLDADTETDRAKSAPSGYFRKLEFKFLDK